eukprot:7780231-Alexandrium_andersonii.AAC.1
MGVLWIVRSARCAGDCCRLWRASAQIVAGAPGHARWFLILTLPRHDRREAANSANVLNLRRPGNPFV